MSVGLVLGKFLPLHAGHVALIEFARSKVDRLIVVLGARPDEPIPGSIRMEWLQSTFADAHIVRVADELPTFPEDDPAFWPKWRSALLSVAPEVSHVFTSELYGDRLARELGATNITFDLGRSAVPISATRIRQDHVTYWELIAPAARPWFLRRIAIVGGESTGKSTLATQLANTLGTLHVPEYGRQHMVGRSLASFTEKDAEIIARRQAELEARARPSARGFVISDTEAVTTAVWTELAGLPVPPAVWQADAVAPFDLYLLCEPDLPWDQDGTREFPDQQLWFRDRLRTHLTRLGRPFLPVGGTGPARLNVARSHVEQAQRSWFGALRDWPHSP